MAPLLLSLAAGCALLAIAADWDERRHRAFYVLKPLTTLLIVAAALAAPASGYRNWVLAALAASLAGDVCLMFRGTRWFLAGLAAFLLAHIAFVVAFLQGLSRIELPAWLGGIALYALAMLALLLPRAGSLRAPVVVYCAALAAMVFAAAARHAVLGGAAALALAGALLFLVSDSALGWRQFRGRFRHAQALILGTYWAAIALIAASA